MIRKFSIESLFLAITFVFGLLYVFLLPPFQSVDEGMHFFRSYQISEGHFVAKNSDGLIGDELPTSLSNFYDAYYPFIKNIDRKSSTQEFLGNFNLKINPQERSFTQFTNTALYSPVCYVSQTVGIFLGKFFSNNLGVTYYLGRISNLIFYCLFVYLALLIAPFFKLPIFLLATLPMSLSLAGAYTCDVAVLGLNFIWFALILRMLVSDDIKISGISVKKYHLPIFMVLAFLITLTKSYILLLPLIFLVLPKHLNSKKEYFTLIFGVIFSAVLAGGIWYAVSHHLTLSMRELAEPNMQTEFIKSHPFAYVVVLIRTFFIKTFRLYITMVGVLGWQDTRLDFITYMAYPVLMFFAIFSDKSDFRLSKLQKTIALLTVLFGVILTYTSLYIMWTPVGNSVVLGLNGKYFIPLMLPFLLLFKNGAGRYDFKTVKLVITIAIVVILISSDFSLLHRFYNMTPQLYYKI